MIKIEVSKRAGEYVRFVSKGHAGYAEEGQDIVCAAVSALIITTVNSIETFTCDKISVKSNDGYVAFRFEKTCSKEAKLLMDSLVLGLTQIHNSYDKMFLDIEFKEV